MSNFSVLCQHNGELLRPGMLAEKYLSDDPNTSILKLQGAIGRNRAIAKWPTETGPADYILVFLRLPTTTGVRPISTTQIAASVSSTQYCIGARRECGYSLQALLARRNWTALQREWLIRIAGKPKANLLVDREALDDLYIVFKRDGRVFSRLDKIFNGDLQQGLEGFNDTLWQPASKA